MVQERMEWEDDDGKMEKFARSRSWEPHISC